MELFGQDFERFEGVQAEMQRAAEAEEAKENEKEAASGDKSKAKKGKLVAKSTGLTYQFQIMESIGVPRSEIKKFADPLYWLTYFPPIAIVRILPTLSTIELFIWYLGRQQRVRFAYRLAPVIPHDRRQPLLRRFCPLAGQQAIQTRKNQVR